MSFIEVQLPKTVARGFSGGPVFSTDVVIVASGSEQRNQNRQDARAEYRATFQNRQAAETKLLIEFFRARKGKFEGFRLNDAIDYAVAYADSSFISLGSNKYQMCRTYTSGGSGSQRRILKPVAGSVSIRVGGVVKTAGVDYTLDTTTGIVTMLVGAPPPAPTDWAGEFDVPVRFDRDRMEVSIVEKGVYSWGDIGMIELLEPT